jgi:MraZ protein
MPLGFATVYPHQNPRFLGQNKKNSALHFFICIEWGHVVDNPTSPLRVELIPLGLLVGNYDLTIDDKNRLLVPSEIRRAIDPDRDGDSFYLVKGMNGKLWMYASRYYETLATRMQSEIAPEEDLLLFDQLNFAQACRVEWDKQGRILVPDKVLRKSELDREVTLIGMRDHLEIWNRAQWEQQEIELERRRSEIAVRARQRQAIVQMNLSDGKAGI